MTRDAHSSWRRPFYTMWAGQAVSILTSSVVQWAIIFYLTFQTNSPAVLAMANFSAFLPQAFLGPFAGTLVDRIPRKIMLNVCDAITACTLLPVIITTSMGIVSVPYIFVALFIRGICQTFQQTAVQATTPLLVPEDELMHMGGYVQAIQSAGYILGTVGGAALYPIMAFQHILLLDIVGAIAAIICVYIIYIPAPKNQDTTKLEGMRELLVHVYVSNKEAFQEFNSHRGFRELLIVSFIFMLFFSPLVAFYPLMTLDYFGGTELQASIVELAYAGGMSVGGMLIGKFLSHADRGFLICLSVLTLGIFTYATGMLPTTAFVPFVVLNVACGLSTALYNTPFMALMQERMSQAAMGRAFGLYGSITMLAMIIGLAISGACAELIGVQTFFIIVGIAISALGVACFFLPKLRTIEHVETSVDTLETEA